MATSKTGGPLKGIFEPAKAMAAQAIMQPQITPTPPAEPGERAGSRNRKAGGRGVRVSGYLPAEISQALQDEVIRRTVAEHHTVSLNDVLCSILSDWFQRQKASTP